MLNWHWFAAWLGGFSVGCAAASWWFITRRLSPMHRTLDRVTATHAEISLTFERTMRAVGIVQRMVQGEPVAPSEIAELEAAVAEQVRARASAVRAKQPFPGFPDDDRPTPAPPSKG